MAEKRSREEVLELMARNRVILSRLETTADSMTLGAKILIGVCAVVGGCYLVNVTYNLGKASGYADLRDSAKQTERMLEAVKPRGEKLQMLYEESIIESGRQEAMRDYSVHKAFNPFY